MQPKAPLGRQQDLVVQELTDEVLVYDLSRHEAHCLNKVAAFVWYHCDGQTGIEELTRLLSEETGLPAGPEMVRLALDELDRAGLLEGAGPRPAGARAVTRRAVMQTLGAGAALALPIVLSVTSPATAQGSVIGVARETNSGGCAQNAAGPGGQNCCLNACCQANASGVRLLCTAANTTDPGTCTGAVCVAPSNNACTNSTTTDCGALNP